MSGIAAIFFFARPDVLTSSENRGKENKGMTPFQPKISAQRGEIPLPSWPRCRHPAMLPRPLRVCYSPARHLIQSFQGFGFTNDFASMGLGERARLGCSATRPRGVIGKKCGRWPVKTLHVVRGAHSKAPGGARAPRDQTLPRQLQKIQKHTGFGIIQK